MWDDLYEALPDNFTVPNWSRLSIEEKQNTLRRMIPQLVEGISPDHPERSNWEQEISQDAGQQELEDGVPGILRYIAFINLDPSSMPQFILKAIEDEDKDLMQFLIKMMVPPAEIIPYITPYMHSDDIPQTTEELRLAFLDGRLRETILQCEPLWANFCQAETDNDALIQIIMYLPPPFPTLLPDHSELRSSGAHDRMEIATGRRGHHIPGFIPDSACLSVRELVDCTSQPVNRVPGRIGFSWNFDLKDLDNDDTLREISKAYMYSNQHQTRYGYVVTDRSLRGFQRLEKDKGSGIPRNRHIEISNIFGLGRYAHLALFYVHLPATHPTNWKLQSTLWKDSIRLYDPDDQTTFIDT